MYALIFHIANKFVMLNLFQHPTRRICISLALHVGSRNKFGMTSLFLYPQRFTIKCIIRT
jgi:hypothetical protein